ncbi:MAG: MFS transporter [SAR202 cluster bacterium]|nr:MFS transporter [SAR202 cluster bacterium]MDP6514365.1 MFS transporter [SAR202 cluster bacterium]MDP6713174.1 MFS transporter [SAR202 cluster bacterium]
MSAIKAFLEWTPRTPIFYGWIILAVGALGTYVATGVAQVTLGGVQSLITDDTGWDRRSLAFAVSAGTWTGAVITPFMGRLTDRFGPRALMPPAALITGVCFFIIADSSALWQFYVGYIIARAVGNPTLVGVVPRTAAVNFFQRRRGLALGLVSTFRPIGGAINIQIISIVAATFSWRAAYRYLGIFSIVLAVPLFVLMRRKPEDIGLRPDGDPPPHSESQTPDVPSTASEVPNVHASEPVWTASQAALTTAFWFVVGAEMLTTLTSATVGFQIVPFLVDGGMSQPLAVTALSLSSLLGALVNPGWGVAADRYSPRRLALIALAVTLLITTFFLVIDGGLPGVIVAVSWGIASGGLNILGSILLARFFGRASFGAISGLMGPFQFGALGLGPILGAMLFTQTGGYTVIWIFSVVCYTIALGLFYAVRPPGLPRSAVAKESAAND